MFLLAVAVSGGCAGLTRSGPPLPRYVQLVSLIPGNEWRFNPVVVDLDGDGHLDLAVTARAGQASLRVWLGDGKGGFTPRAGSWTDSGYGPLAAGDVNGDGRPDIVGASHFARVQTLLNNGGGTFTEKVFLGRQDGYAGIQLADLDGDGHLDLVLLGYSRAGIEIYRGDGTGTWTLHRTLPDPRPLPVMPGRALAIADLNRDGHPDIVAAFQRAGVYVYYGDGRGEFTGGRVDFYSATEEFESVAIGDVNQDGHPDIVINGASGAPGRPEGPDVYLGDSRGGWKASAAGLKALKAAMAGVALGDLDRDGHLDIVAGGLARGEGEEGYGVFWFRGDGKGGWSLVKNSGLPDRGLSIVHSITLADLDRDGRLEVIVVAGQFPFRGSITIWSQRSP